MGGRISQKKSRIKDAAKKKLTNLYRATALDRSDAQ